MPTISIYIRAEDYSRYLDIENKGEFIHNALNGVGGFRPGQLEALNEIGDAIEKELEPIKTPNDKIIEELSKPTIIPVIKTPEDANLAVGEAITAEVLGRLPLNKSGESHGA